MDENSYKNTIHDDVPCIWTRTMMYPYKCEKGAQMYRLGITGYVSKIRVTNIPHARIYIDDIILQDILGDTVIDIAAYMQCIYKELRTHVSFPTLSHGAATSILKQSGNSRLDQSDKKLISVNDITVDSLMSLSRYDRKFNSLNTSKCTISIRSEDNEDIMTHDWYNINARPCVEYITYVEPNVVNLNVNTATNKSTTIERSIVDVTRFESTEDGKHVVASKMGISSSRRELCCIIL